MGVFNPSILTQKGKNLIAKSVAGACNITFTKIAVSDTPLTGDISQRVDIGVIKQSEKVSSVTMQGDSRAKISTSFSNTNLTAGYFIRNIGLYAMDPAEGEILYSISVANENTATADYMPPFSSIAVSSLVVDVISVVSSTASVNLTVDPTATATITQIKDLQSQINDVKTFVGYEDDIYGVEVDFTSRTITRISGAEHLTEGADFDFLAPWGGRKRCIITDTGVRLAYYGEEGYTESGALTQAITIGETTYAVGTLVQVMVEQPLFYIKAVPVKTKDASSGRGKQYVKARFYISLTPKDSFSIPRAFYDDNGIVQDKIYLSAYEGGAEDAYGRRYLAEDPASIVEGNVSYFNLASVAGLEPICGAGNTLTRSLARNLAERRAGWQLHNIFAVAVTQWLFMIEYASLDPQRKIGLGVSNTTYGYGIPKLAGTTASLGNGSGIPSGGTDGECSVTYRGEENLWGNLSTWIDGINYYFTDVNEVWVPKIGTKMKDDTTSGYECLAFSAPTTEGFVSAFGVDERYPDLFIPTEVMGEDTFADYFYAGDLTGFNVGWLGGTASHNSKCGFFLGVTASTTHTGTIGGRLLYIPQSTKA